MFYSLVIQNSWIKAIHSGCVPCQWHIEWIKSAFFFEMRQFLPQSSLTKNNLLHPVCRWLKTKTIAFDKMFRFFFCLYCSIQTNDFTNNNNRPKKITINLNLFYEIYLFIIIYYYCWFSHSHPVCTASHHCKCLSHLYNIRV